MSLTFGAGATDRVSVTAHSSIDSLPQRTIMAWVYPTTLSVNRGIWSKKDNSGTVNRFVLDATTGTNLRMLVLVSGSPAACSVITNNANLTTNKWWFMGATFNKDAVPQGKIYLGDLATLATERTYSTQQSSSTTTLPSDSNSPLVWGNTDQFAGAFSVPIQGRMGVAAYFDRTLTLGEIQAWQFDPRMIAGCVDLKRFGDNGASTQTDYSGHGNGGAVTGATQSDNPPLRRWRRAGSLFVPSSVIIPPATPDPFITVEFRAA